MAHKSIRLVLEFRVEDTDRPKLEKFRVLCELANTNHEFIVEGSVLDGLLVAPVSAVVQSITEYPVYEGYAAEHGTQINLILRTPNYGR